MEDEEDISKL